MKKIEDFLDKFKRLIKYDKEVKAVIRKAIKDIVGVELEDKDIKIQNKIIYIKTSPQAKSEIFIKKERFILNVIKGIFDTDGMIYLQPKYGKLYPRIEISTISKELGYQLNKFINQLGIRSTIYVWRKGHPNWNDAYKISVRGEKMLNKWMRIIEPHNSKHIKKFKFYLNNS